MLATVLFTDIVGSTDQAVGSVIASGVSSWTPPRPVRALLGGYRGVEVVTAGDGFYATFDGPARAIRCAMEVTERVRPLGIEVRAGVHTGECEVIEEKCGGITVSIGSRVAAHASPSEVLVSQTVKDLVAGSGCNLPTSASRTSKASPTAGISTG